MAGLRSHWREGAGLPCAERKAAPWFVVVQRRWNDWRTATIRAADLEDLHWFQPAGAPRPLIHASVNCRDLVSGDVLHDGHTAACQDRFTVCLLKSHTIPGVYEMLARAADGAA